MATTSIPLGGIDLRTTLKPLAFFPSDPTVSLAEGRFVRSTWTPDGTGAVRITWDDDHAEVETVGDGARYLSDRVSALLGLDDDVSTFDPSGHPLVSRLARTFAGMRITASHTLWHDVAWLVPGQRVATVDAARQWASFSHRFGTPISGVDTVAPPSPSETARLAYYELHPCGIERRRAESVIAAARAMPRLETLQLDSATIRPALERIRGIGPWMSTNVAAMTCGDPDAVVLGDYGLPSSVAWALARERTADDERMLELLEPFRPHRWRVVRLIMTAGIAPPRHGPKRRNPRVERL